MVAEKVDGNQRGSDPNPANATAVLRELIDKIALSFEQAVTAQRATVRARESGMVISVSRGIATVGGLPNVQSDELLRFDGNRHGFAFNLDRHSVGCVLLDPGETLQAGTTVDRTGRVLDTPVGDELIGRVIDPLGRPLDGGHRLTQLPRMPCERDAPAIMQRAAVSVPLQTGLKVVDGLIPIGRGQRQLILGDRQTGKTSIATDTIINQKDNGVICIYCSIGQRSTNVARVIDSFRARDAMKYTIVVIGADDAPPGVQFIAPYAATTIGEYFMNQGRDVLVVYDDLTSHARAYRHVSLLLRRPPGREAFPGDIFFVHSRLLERSTHLREESGGGSLTALPIIETEAQNVSGYIPTNLISITDGQLYLSPKLFHLGVLPAVDVGRSVSRVGGKTQLPAFRAVAGDLRLAYSQFEELEKFSRFSSQLDKETRETLDRGLRAREILKQPQLQLLTVPDQIGSMLALTSGTLDGLPIDRIRQAEIAIHRAMNDQLPDLCDKIIAGCQLSVGDLSRLKASAQAVAHEMSVEKPCKL
jgi:F-type H+-transporting ATPase subunit alpha